MSRLNKILAGALVLQLGLIVITWATGDRVASVRPLEPILGDVDADDVTRVKIFDKLTGGGDARLAIDVQKAGDDWLLRSHYDYPADPKVANDLVGKLAGMAARGPTATAEDRQAQLEVAATDYRRKIVLTTPSGDTTLYLGSETGFQQTAVRLDGDRAIYTVSDLNAREAPTRLDDWIDPVWVDIPKASIAGLTVDNANGSVTLEKNADGNWLRLRPGADPDRVFVAVALVEPLVQAASRMEITDVVAAEPAPSHGFDTPRARVTMALAATGGQPQETYVIELGNAVDSDVYARTLDRKQIVRVPAKAVQKLIDLSADGLPASEAPPPKPSEPAAPGFP
jgi:hypothetical protein